ncbi:MAG: four helix bundle suffix domain-containing protein [Alistipes sp.]|nr:four helix bundle suffix domain-containing protein [Alistipes sp.]
MENATNKIALNTRYSNLLCYQKSVVIFDLTHHFCDRFISKHDRTFDQMVQAARSGKQNITEGHASLSTSKESGIKLLNVARASLLELLEDYNDYLRLRGIGPWSRESVEAKTMASLGVEHSDSQYFITMAESRSDIVIANMTIILIKQAVVLIEKYIKSVISRFAKEGGFREEMTKVRLETRKKQN